MKKHYKNSLKALEADIEHANSLALDSFTGDMGGYIQLRLHFSVVAALFSFLFPWSDCKVAGGFGFIHVIIYTIYGDGETAMHIHMRKASIKQFYEVVFPSIMQLQRGVTDLEEKKQKVIWLKRYAPKDEDKGELSEADLERETECGICMETTARVVLPNCSHSLCLKCYSDWHGRSKSCPFCRESLKEVKLTDLWICVEADDIIDTPIILKENSKRLLMYIEKLPLLVRSPKG